IPLVPNASKRQRETVLHQMYFMALWLSNGLLYRTSRIQYPKEFCQSN
ncbi:Uncharacterized protein APZ42_002430, partial [Daphnia magna]